MGERLQVSRRSVGSRARGDYWKNSDADVAVPL
ncbi:MAG: nucleotidyltransferase domain-containing protein [Candidatus Freyarchaeota archaeon]|nr:nucleotidyltransferase domain-containing protein [Candidatus Jordarchaeia archaeon]